MIEVTITGPGGCIHSEFHVIKEALENAGFTVNVKTEGCSKPDSRGNGFMKRYAELVELGNTFVARGITDVTLVVEEYPWGG